jgi:hypothetical protein
MIELPRAIPDVEVLLALEPEELGAKLLFLARKRTEALTEHGAMFHPENMIHELWNQSLSGNPQGAHEAPRCVGAPQRKVLSVKQHGDLVVGKNFVVRPDQHGIAIMDRDRGSWLDGGRRVDRFVLERHDVVGKWQVDGLDVCITEPDRLQQCVEGRGVAHPRAIHGEPHAPEVLDVAVASALHMVATDKDLGSAIFGRRRRFVGDADKHVHNQSLAWVRTDREEN